ncbi:MAG TPA: undecaprenyldiphospho-muramoylpentapeptide beta-N-acetylglucosaminyltransferase [Candidatus Faecousia intestinigallinarum]|nr:undecaprenyldiphospho-muramoylpentapeptide beta-N-acetylglucosaminyltransferase [Candidatus Faecousia intestinigallinarum]
MNVVFTCGGTAGHINPAIAVANIWKERHPQGNVLFIGGDDMEQTLVPKAGYEFIGFESASFRRGLTFGALRHNVRAAFLIARAVQKCKKLLRDFQADVVVGTGGYASFPALQAAKMLHIPTCVHESNAMPGLTTRLVADWVDRVLICFPESAGHYRHPEKAEVVGMPVRREFIYTEKAAAKKELGLDDRPLVVSAFGSQGAREMNLAIGKLFRLEQDGGFPFQHIHAVGSFGWEWMPAYVKEQGVDLSQAKSIDMREYVYNMPTVMAAADVIISRAGASTCNEIAASGTPCILIPSPNVTDNHQEKNARVLERAGGAVVILEKDCTPQRLYQELQALLLDPRRCRDMRAALQNMSVPDSAERICDIVDRLAGGRG